jgi:hypothetical protein
MLITVMNDALQHKQQGGQRRAVQPHSNIAAMLKEVAPQIYWHKQANTYCDQWPPDPSKTLGT